jgi:hypothetical protein
MNRYQLSNEKIKIYNENWNHFEGKNIILNSSYVNSNNPSISQIYNFQNIYKTKVFSQSLKNFELNSSPFMSIYPYWDGFHYQIVGKQLFFASQKLRKGLISNQESVLEYSFNIAIRKKILWRDNISVELIYDKNKSNELTFYFINEKTTHIVALISSKIKIDKREYVKTMDDILLGKDLFSKLISQVERFNLIKNKQNFSNNELYYQIIKGLKSKDLQENELHQFFDFFSK